MNPNSVVPLKDQKEKPHFRAEVANEEKQLWALIGNKGLLHSDVQNLYRKLCSSYEKIIWNDRELAELQDVEYYSLWKLHYMHVEEFRKRIERNSADAESAKPSVDTKQSNSDNHIEGFKSFLSEAAEFYQNLIMKVRRFDGLPEQFPLCKRGDISTSVEQKNLKKRQFLCHRFLVCLGDIARYREQYEKPDVHNHNWSVAGTHYLEATLVWPDSGSAQNQLAVLATYVGDDFLALYHCIRSLAVKEPFRVPDAWNNLILLFERNRSSHLPSFSSEGHFDFLKPSERSSVGIRSTRSDGFPNCNMQKAECEASMETNLWPLIIRMISFFFVKSSLEDFPCAFASSMKKLDMLMALDDTKLKTGLESYQHMDSARTGPFRALQIVAIFIFVIENLISPEANRLKDLNDAQQHMLMQFALTAAFIFMGRLVDRCLEANMLESCPLLPAVLVFVEWLVSMVEKAERYGDDEKSVRAMSYFFGAFVGLVNRFKVSGCEQGSGAIWEDYELRGFLPVACAHVSLDFLTHWGPIDSFESGSQCRVHRITTAAMRIADRPNNCRSWILYDKLGRKFYAPERAESNGSDLEVIELHQHIDEATEECEKHPTKTGVHGKSDTVTVEEEEEILFKPLTRYNSAPLYSSVAIKDQISSKDTGDQILPADECLRRATSLLIAQNQAWGDPSAFHSDITNFRRNRSLKQQEAHVNDAYSEAPMFGAGPPSLNAWVVDRGISLSNGKNDTSMHSLVPIHEEIASASLNALSISGAEHESGAAHYSSPAHSVPLPSAPPLLPDDAAWYSGVQSRFPDSKSLGLINKADNFSDTSQVSGYSNWAGANQPINYSLGIPGFMNVYTPFRGLSSSEWLRQYRETHNLDWAGSYMWPARSYAPGDPGNFHAHGVSNFDYRGTPVASNPLICTEGPPFPAVYGADEHTGERLFHNYQRPSPYGCGAMTDLRGEPQTLVQYLREKEWLVQRDPTLRGPTYMGN